MYTPLKRLVVLTIVTVAIGMPSGYFGARYLTLKDHKVKSISSESECINTACSINSSNEANPFKSNDGDKVIWP